MKAKYKNYSNNLGFMESKLYITMTIIFLLAALGLISLGKEYYKIKMCEECSENLQMIEKAKEAYRKAHPNAKPDMYSDLLPYMPVYNFPKCPWGGKYEYELELNHEVTCSLNGNEDYEPKTKNDSMENGYMDVAITNPPMSIIDFLKQKIGVGEKPETEKIIKQKQKESLFRE